MIIKITKIFTIGAFEKEEKWINEMAAKGLNLINVSGIRYTFQEGTPGEYTYRLEFLKKFPNHYDSVKYLQFLEETGVECVATFMRWVYLRKKKSEGEFILYSDFKSKLDHYKRIRLFGFIISIIPVTEFFSNLTHLFVNSSHHIDNALYIFLVTLMILLFGFIQLQMIPIYKVISKLKSEMKIHE